MLVGLFGGVSVNDPSSGPCRGWSVEIAFPLAAISLNNTNSLPIKPVWATSPASAHDAGARCASSVVVRDSGGGTGGLQHCLVAARLRAAA